MFGLYFRERVPENLAEVMQCDRARFNHFFHAMLERGVYLAPSGYEVGFLSIAHRDEDLLQTAEAVRESLKEVFG